MKSKDILRMNYLIGLNDLKSIIMVKDSQNQILILMHIIWYKLITRSKIVKD